MGTAKADHKAIDTDIHLETDNGNLIKIDSDSWFQWLGENASFKFTAGFGGEDSYRARKEVLGGVVYWYAFKKVNGKLHKRYIGKPHEVTHNRLCEVAKSIRDVKVRPAKEDKINNDSNQIVNTNLQEIVNQLVNQVQELSNRLDNLENKGDNTNEKKPEYLPSEELEVRIEELERVNKELTKQLTSEQVKVSSLSKNLQHREDNFPYSLEYIKQFGDFYIDALRHKEKLPSIEVDQYKIGARKFINFIEVNREVPSPSGGFSHGMDFNLKKGEDIVSLSSYLNELTSELYSKNSKLSELTNELANKDSQLQELTNTMVNLNSKLSELTNKLANKDSQLQDLKSVPVVLQSPINEQLTTDNVTTTPGETDDGQFTEDVKSDRPNADPSPQTDKQRKIIDFFADVNIYSPVTADVIKSSGIGEKIKKNKEELKQILGEEIDTKSNVVVRVRSILKKAGFDVGGNRDQGYFVKG
ncbi:MAG: hypothetical protein ACKPKT_26610 [Dolichospermum sp.]